MRSAKLLAGMLFSLSTMSIAYAEGPDCNTILKLHGMLTRAQFQCGYSQYSTNLMEQDAACWRSDNAKVCIWKTGERRGPEADRPTLPYDPPPMGTTVAAAAAPLSTPNNTQPPTAPLPNIAQLSAQESPIPAAPPSDQEDKPVTVASMRKLCEMQRSDAPFDSCGQLLDQMLDMLISLGQKGGKSVVCMPNGRPSTNELKRIFMTATEENSPKMDELPAWILLGYATFQYYNCPV